MKVVLTNVELTDTQWDLYNKKQEHLAEIAKIDAYFKAEGIEFSNSRIDRFLDAVTDKVNEWMLNSKPVMSAFRHLFARNIRGVLAVSEETRHTVRLYSLEGRHLSRKVDKHQPEEEAFKRMTWYMDPVEAIEIGEYMGGLTGKLVYIDLELDFCSDYSFTFNKLNAHIYTLKGDLINVAKRSWKYAKSSDVTRVVSSKVASAHEEGAVTRVTK